MIYVWFLANIQQAAQMAELAPSVLCIRCLARTCPHPGQRLSSGLRISATILGRWRVLPVRVAMAFGGAHRPQ